MFFFICLCFVCHKKAHELFLSIWHSVCVCMYRYHLLEDTYDAAVVNAISIRYVLMECAVTSAINWLINNNLPVFFLFFLFIYSSSKYTLHSLLSAPSSKTHIQLVCYVILLLLGVLLFDLLPYSTYF